jgi:hypothetical protein
MTGAHRDPPAKMTEKDRPKASKKAREEREVLKEQAKTEVEERPYLDTEGGE